jgi:hypothetical protein
LLVRFDRINRKVYVHRPRYAGGVVTLDWDKVITVELNVSQTGSPLFLDWYPIDTPNGLNELLMVGRRTRYGTEYRDVWEFIRRYMEDGPSSVPYQKLLGKIPWPWRALQMTLGTLWEMVRSAPLPAQIVVTLILLPVALVFALWQWISLLLCWEPVFPRKIRAACGESFMAVVRTRIIDLVAWTMLGGAFWLMWPNIKMVMRDCGCEFL